MKKKRSLFPFFFILLLFSGIALIAGTVHFMHFKEDISIIIEEGDTPTNVLRQIKETNSMPILNLIPEKITQKIIGSKIKTGIYKINQGQSFLELIMKIKRGIAEKCSITFIPGKTIYDYKKQLEENTDFRGIITAEILEGEILPDTYTFFCGISKNTVLKYAKEQMEDFLSSVTSDIDFSTFYLKNIDEVVILASIVEKETGIAQERQQVAGVFKNRMAIGMKLQTDPTVIYQESKGTGDLGRAITGADLRKSGEYNTYIIPSLPIGAIANPSRESILAVLKPDQTDALYFVASPYSDGTHNFAKTYQEHLENVEAYRKRGQVGLEI